MADRKEIKKIGQMLVHEGLITETQLQEALNIQKGGDNHFIGEILVRLGYVQEKDIAMVIGKQLDIPYASIQSGLLNPATNQNLKDIIPEKWARYYTVLPISKNLNRLTIAFADPRDLIIMDNLKKLTGLEINPIIATKSDVLKAINIFYGHGVIFEEIMSKSYQSPESEAATSTAGVKSEREEELDLDRVVAMAEESSIIKLVDLIIKEAITQRASDIHIEPGKDRLGIRYRIDGILYEISPPPKHLLAPIISRIKILSAMDIAERRLPQDGGFTVKMEDRFIDMRVSTVPTVYGEKVVMRILDKTSMGLDIKQLGFEPNDLSAFEKAIHNPYGLILITGPTGSGKTTTLYSAVNEIKSPQKNIVSIEDPVEYQLDGINQVQYNIAIGLTFASAVRAFLRQDPDVIMVGEVRDLETAESCIRAALTGHLVLSTLHTNDAPSAVTRLVEIGIEPFLTIASLIIVVAQRLLRKLCLECKEAYEPDPNILRGIPLSQDLIYKPKGCTACKQTGYRGRVAIYEVLPLSDKIKEMVIAGTNAAALKKVARETGMRTLRENGLKKVAEGITSLEEILSVTSED